MVMNIDMILLLFIFCISRSCYSLKTTSDTGFWYHDTRPPNVRYDTVPYANLTVKVNRPFTDGPGQDLVTDPFNHKISLYVGNTINRQTFDSQFILDLNYALGISVDRVYVISVFPGKVHFTWESNYVIVNFIFLERSNTNDPTLLQALAQLTNQIQLPNSKLYKGTNVTSEIDPLWGLEVLTWDTSLKLTYPIDIIGGKEVRDGYYLNQGSLGICDDMNIDSYNVSTYCEFERFFEDDVSRALNITYYRVQVLFIKTASLDSVLVHFRITPEDIPSDIKSDNIFTVDRLTQNITQLMTKLAIQISDLESELYKGNVTIRTDPTWGLEGSYKSPRQMAAKFTLKYYDQSDLRLSNPIRRTMITAYDRCKANRRCNWGIVEQDQYTNDVRFFQRLYDRGALYETTMFLDFEDWRMGTRGFSWTGYIPPTAKGATSIPRARAADGFLRGAHFWPFHQVSLGPDIPCFEKERNQGLVLDRLLQRQQIDRQEALIDDIKGRIDFLGENIEDASMNAQFRSRKDVRANLTWVQADFFHWWQHEVIELNALNSSQCVQQSCVIQFNTTSLLLTGAINDTGVVKLTKEGTEVALFTFNSIYLGPEVKIIVVGQRALSLLSKTTLFLNTTIEAMPGTLGGFQGGQSVGRYQNDSLSDTPRPIFICDLGDYCSYNTSNYNTKASFEERSHIVSNNVNGPGSGNLRINPFVIRTYADYIQEIQVITTTALKGQTLSGGFTIQFKDYSTPIIPHDCSALLMKRIIEENLNLIAPNSAAVYVNRDLDSGAGLAGVGIVNVTRPFSNDQEGYTWKITYTTAIGNVPQIKVKSYLKGIQASISTYTEREGNEILGFFQLEFQGVRSAPIAAAESAKGLESILESMPMISTAYVRRNDPTQNCDDGFCPNGPYTSRGLMWTVYITTNASIDNITPTSPTSPNAKIEAPHYHISVHYENLKGLNSTAVIYFGTSKSRESPLNLLDIKYPFSLAWGGGGGSYGGYGGQGYGINPIGPKYNDEKITDLIGGSGGCMYSIHPYAINSALGPTIGNGGHGGGAIELIAANDITIGSYGQIRMRGGDAEQTPEGGGGGGSGGAILLSSGTSILIDGLLDVTGGNGGYGGSLHPDLAGGGGGGGRIALYAESITVIKNPLVDGGKCGILKTSVPHNATELGISMYMVMISPLDNARLIFIGNEFISSTFSPNIINFESIEMQSNIEMCLAYDQNKVCAKSINTIHVLLNMTAVIYQSSAIYKQSKFEEFEKKLNESVGMNIAEVTIASATINSMKITLISPIESVETNCQNNGNAGTFYSEAKMTTDMYIKNTLAAENTNRALFLSNRENTNTSTGSGRESPFAGNGPIVPFEASRPDRITYYTRTDAVRGESTKSDYGSLVTLLSRGEAGLNISNVIGVFFGSKIMHGANFGSAVDEKAFLKRMVSIDNYPILNRWYKIDIKIQWVNHTYLVAIDDSIVVTNAPFTGDDVDGIRLSTYRAVDVWFDEIYVGFDNSLEFQCPITLRTGTGTMAPVQRGWSFEEVRGKGSLGYTEYITMQRHYNFLNPAGSIPFDGQGHIKVNQDIKLQYTDGDYPLKQGDIHAGALVYLTDSLRSGKAPLEASKTLVSPLGLWSGVKDGIGGAGDGRQFWYTEYNYVSDLSDTLNGGVAACSSQDLTTWRFEGIVFHYANLSDQVFGNPGPYYVERPKVLFNKPTGQYVMWAVMDNDARQYASCAIATSPYEDGPFLFRRSFYPDGNRTRDQVIYINDIGVPYLARTYYQTVEFLLPQAIMQPVWESAKDRSGQINYRSNYHRAVYDPGYDNYNDIYNQRWRKEDVKYNVQCINKITGSIRTPLPGVYIDGAVCIDPDERKVVLGQGNPPVQTRFVSPNDSENSWWRPTSVPGVRSQAWSNNYREGYCGIRQLNDGFDLLDPDLAQFVPTDRSNCSNIADNPVHPTLQDKLIGLTRVITTRRAKFVAISQLTYDFLDTNGWLSSFEGELETGNMISMIVEMGQFGFESGDKIQSTFRPPVRSEFETAIDFKTRYSQYIRNVNDRAKYSLACVLDGVCSVNFRDQLKPGQN